MHDPQAQPQGPQPQGPMGPEDLDDAIMSVSLSSPETQVPAQSSSSSSSASTTTVIPALSEEEVNAIANNVGDGAVASHNNTAISMSGGDININSDGSDNGNDEQLQRQPAASPASPHSDQQQQGLAMGLSPEQQAIAAFTVSEPVPPRSNSTVIVRFDNDDGAHIAAADQHETSTTMLLRLMREGRLRQQRHARHNVLCAVPIVYNTARATGAWSDVLPDELVGVLPNTVWRERVQRLNAAVRAAEPSLRDYSFLILTIRTLISFILIFGGLIFILVASVTKWGADGNHNTQMLVILLAALFLNTFSYGGLGRLADRCLEKAETVVDDHIGEWEVADFTLGLRYRSIRRLASADHRSRFTLSGVLVPWVIEVRRVSLSDADLQSAAANSTAIELYELPTYKAQEDVVVDDNDRAPAYEAASTTSSSAVAGAATPAATSSPLPAFSSSSSSPLLATSTPDAAAATTADGAVAPPTTSRPPAYS